MASALILVSLLFRGYAKSGPYSDQMEAQSLNTTTMQHNATCLSPVKALARQQVAQTLIQTRRIQSSTRRNWIKYFECSDPNLTSHL